MDTQFTPAQVATIPTGDAFRRGLVNATDTQPERLEWGHRWLVDDELTALRVAYVHRNSKYGVQVRPAPGAGKWAVTVFNEFAATLRIDRS